MESCKRMQLEKILGYNNASTLPGSPHLQAAPKAPVRQAILLLYSKHRLECLDDA